MQNKMDQLKIKMLEWRSEVEDHLMKCKKEIRTAPYWRDIFCELLATFFLISTQSTVALTFGRLDVFGGRLIDSLSMGFSVAVLIEVFGPLGGAHMNPAVSFSFVILGQLTILKAIFYTIAQCMGACLGSLIVKGLTPVEFQEHLAVTSVHPGLTTWQGMFAEMWITVWLVFAIHGSSNDERHPVYMNSIIIGFAVVVGSNVGAYRTGGSMNPARSFGPAAVLGIWKDQWVYWVGPFAGSIFGTLMYFQVCDRIGRNSPSDVLDGDMEEATGEPGQVPGSFLMQDDPSDLPPYSRRASHRSDRNRAMSLETDTLSGLHRLSRMATKMSDDPALHAPYSRRRASHATIGAIPMGRDRSMSIQINMMDGLTIGDDVNTAKADHIPIIKGDEEDSLPEAKKGKVNPICIMEEDEEERLPEIKKENHVSITILEEEEEEEEKDTNSSA